jgi:hypothetical protein
MDYGPGGGARPRGHHLDPKYAPLLAPAITAVAMSFAISLVTTTVRLGSHLTCSRPGSPPSRSR